MRPEDIKQEEENLPQVRKRELEVAFETLQKRLNEAYKVTSAKDKLSKLGASGQKELSTLKAIIDEMAKLPPIKNIPLCKKYCMSVAMINTRLGQIPNKPKELEEFTNNLNLALVVYTAAVSGQTAQLYKDVKQETKKNKELETSCADLRKANNDLSTRVSFFQSQNKGNVSSISGISHSSLSEEQKHDSKKIGALLNPHRHKVILRLQEFQQQCLSQHKEMQNLAHSRGKQILEASDYTRDAMLAHNLMKSIVADYRCDISLSRILDQLYASLQNKELQALAIGLEGVIEKNLNVCDEVAQTVGQMIGQKKEEAIHAVIKQVYAAKSRKFFQPDEEFSKFNEEVRQKWAHTSNGVNGLKK